MEYINSRKRLIVNTGFFSRKWCLQYWVKTAISGYQWITVSECEVLPSMRVNEVVVFLETLREVSKWDRKGWIFDVEDELDAKES